MRWQDQKINIKQLELEIKKLKIDLCKHPANKILIKNQDFYTHLPAGSASFWVELECGDCDKTWTENRCL